MRDQQINYNDVRIGKKQVCVSMSVSDFAFMKNSGYSPTRLLRRAVENLRNDKSQESFEEMFLKVERMSKIIQQMAQFLENKDLTEQFGTYQDKCSEEEIKIHKEKVEKATNKVEDVDNILNAKILPENSLKQELNPKEKEDDQQKNTS